MTISSMIGFDCPAPATSSLGIAGFCALITLVITFWYNHRTAQISLRTNIITLLDKFISQIDDESLSTHNRAGVEKFYSIVITFIQLIDTSGLKGTYKESTKEAFWLLCSPHAWDEMYSGLAAKEICAIDKNATVLKSHRVSAVAAFEDIILKHKKSQPINRFLPLAKD